MHVYVIEGIQVLTGPEGSDPLGLVGVSRPISLAHAPPPPTLSVSLTYFLIPFLSCSGGFAEEKGQCLAGSQVP